MKHIPVGTHGKSLAIALVCNVAATLLSFLVQALGFSEVNIVVIYILSVLVISLCTKGYVYGVATSVVSMLSFNFFFSQPVFSFNVYDTAYIFTFVVMLVAALTTSTLTTRLLAITTLSNRKEREAQTLYAVASALGKAGGLEGVAAATVRCLAGHTGGPVLCVLHRPGQSTGLLFATQPGTEELTTRPVDETETAALLRGTHVVPLRAQGQVLAVLGLPPHTEDYDGRALLDSMVVQATTALERELLNLEKQDAEAAVEQERYRGNLLRAISHDLRTPLTAISGSAEMLVHTLQEEDSRHIAQSIYEDVNWLTRLVENILNLTRLQENRVELSIRPEVVDEVVGAAVERAARYAPEHTIHAEVPGEVLLVPMDARLIQQVLLNLTDNAIRHTAPGGEIRVDVKAGEGKVWFSVQDNGSGIPEEDLPRVFDMFYTNATQHGDAKRGIGLGLAICRGIVRHHGGEITAANSPGGGAVFRFYLPAKEA